MKRRPGQSDNLLLRAIGRTTTASVAQLARQTGIGRSTVRRALDRLIAAGKLQRGERSGAYAFEYRPPPAKSPRKRRKLLVSLGARDLLIESMADFEREAGVRVVWYGEEPDLRLYVNLPGALKYNARLKWTFSPAGPAMNLHVRETDHGRKFSAERIADYRQLADRWIKRIAPRVNRWWKQIAA